MGNSPIQDVYSCVADTSYPSSTSACAAGTKLNNTYGSSGGGSPSYSCYVPQDISATVSPSSCPIPRQQVKCATGFVFDEASNLAWKGTGVSWGCSYKCIASPDPHVSTPNWPCTKTGYKPIGGGGGETCCAKW